MRVPSEKFGLEQDARWLRSKGGGDTDVTGTGVPKMRLQSRDWWDPLAHEDCEAVVGGKLQSLGGPHLFSPTPRAGFHGGLLPEIAVWPLMMAD